MKTWTLTLLVVVVTSTIARAETCVNTCTADYSPVCGSDGKTYGNKCEFEYEKCKAKNESLTIVSTGECPASSGSSDKSCPISCPALYDPVCASNGKTYGSECQLKIASCKDNTIKLAHKGACGSSSGSGGAICDNVACPAIYGPVVCGSDGKTYYNDCELEIAKCKTPTLTVASKGECPKQGSKTGSSSGGSEPAKTPSPVPSPTTSGANSLAAQTVATVVAMAIAAMA